MIYEYCYVLYKMTDCTCSSFSLQPGTRYTVGRQPSCDIIVQDQHVSALHCCIWAREGKPGDQGKPVDRSDSDVHGDSEKQTKGDSDIHGDSEKQTKGDSDIHGDSVMQAKGDSDIHDDDDACENSDAQGNSGPTGDIDMHSDARGDGNTGIDSGDIDVAYIVDLSTNGTWLERMGQPSSSSTIAAKRIARKESVPLRFGDVLHLKSPLMFPVVASCSLELRRCGEGVCVAAATSDVSTGVVEFVRPGDKERVDGPGSEGKENCVRCIPSPKRARCSEDNETTTVPATDKSASGDSQFECCPMCMRLFAISELIEHAPNCASNERAGDTASSSGTSGGGKDAVEQCQFCWMLFSLSDLISHVPSCPARSTEDRGDCSGAVTSSQDAGGEGVERCMHCFRDFPLSRLVVHAERCRGDMLGVVGGGRFKAFLPSVHDLDALSLSVLSPTQRAAVEYVVGQSRTASNAVKPRLLERVQRLGYAEADLQRTFYWVRNEAPVIIHLNLSSVLEHLVRDTHYRNLFEDNIFNKIYRDSPPEERVKYGVLNIVGDIEGVKPCYSYGDSFLQLKKVRLRTTFASADTAYLHVKLACCEHYANVLYEYSDSELKAILDVATRRKPWADSNIISQYKEVQIHGPVCLSENVDCIVVNSRFRRDSRVKKLLKEFVQRNGCNLIWMDAAEIASDAGSSLEGMAEEVGSPERRWWEEGSYYSSYED